MITREPLPNNIEQGGDKPPKLKFPPARTCCNRPVIGRRGSLASSASSVSMRALARWRPPGDRPAEQA
jgi:hypothetical protein